MRDPAAVAALQGSVARTAEWLRATCEAERAAGRRVYGYCAASRAVALLRVAGLDASLLTAVADASPDKHGRRMPGTDIPIIAPDALVAARPDVVLLFVSDLAAEVRAALPQIEAARRALGGRRRGPLTRGVSGGQGTNGRSSLSGPSRTISAVDGGTSCHSPGRSISGSDTTTRASSEKCRNRSSAGRSSRRSCTDVLTNSVLTSGPLA